MLEAGRSELGIFIRIFGKCRGGYRDKTGEVGAGGLKTYLRLSLTRVRVRVGVGCGCGCVCGWVCLKP